MYILGISCYYHDASAALLKDGAIVAAAEEERFTRKKHDISFPINAINYCLKSQNITINDIEHRIYTEQKSESTTGTEVSVVGNFQLPFNLTYSTNADFLFPFSKDDDYTMEWENVINLKLFKYISLDYKLKLENKIPETGDEYIVEKHSLFLRVTYFLR